VARPESSDTIPFKGEILYPEDIGKKISYYIQNSDSENIETVSKLPHNLFIHSTENIPNLGVSKNTVWLRCFVQNQTENSKLFFEIDNPILDNVTLFYKNSTNNWESQTISKELPFENRKVKNQKFIFSLDLPPSSIQIIYLSVVTNTPKVFPCQIGIPEQINDRNNDEDILSGVYLGLMLVMFLYNLFVYFTVRDKSYLYYIVYILSITIMQVVLKGLGFRYFWPSNPAFEQFSIFLLPAVTAFTSIAFMNNFLHTAVYAPRLRKILYLFVVSYIVTVCIALWGDRTVSYNLLNVNALPLALFMIGTAAYIWFKHRYRPAAFFLIAWTFFLLSIILFVLKEVGVLPNNIFTTSIILIGSSIEALLLSFALADKINIYRKEKDAAQAESLQTARENERIIREQNITLESKVTDRTKELKHTNDELNTTLSHLKETQSQLVESEKMASLGQLTAGIAHEINNPINFVTSNVKPLKRDVSLLLDLMLKLEETASLEVAASEKQKRIDALKTEYDFDYLKEEIEFLLKGINEGSTRTAEIVKGLRIFSRVDEDDLKKADINEGLDSTIIIINNLLNGKITIDKQYGNIPLVECYPGKLNQVFLNLISNAIYAINARIKDEAGGKIVIKTEAKENTVVITIEDNGCGMNESTRKRLFEPFFTTKPVGEGTGLGLSISHNTIKKHFGKITVQSTLNEGTTFTIEIPIIHPNS
jgi:signal transduction histidine kinase